MTTNDGGGAIRVAVAASSAVRRSGFEAIVRDETSLRLSGSAPSLFGLQTRFQELNPDVVVADLGDSDPQFPSTVASLGQKGISLVALIDNPNPSWTARSLRAGLRAILPRDSSSQDILTAIYAANRGLVLLDPEVAESFGTVPRPGNPQTTSGVPEQLTPREVEVLRLLAEGLGNKEISSRLGVSEHTAKFHISSILAKLGATSRTEAVTMGIRMGLVLL
jgi:two-component system, NarL family, response regulator YdfI